MLNQMIIISIGICSIAFLYYTDDLWFVLYLWLTIFCLCLGPLVVILINIALSPKHRTGLGTTKTIAEIDAFNNLLMVSVLFS